MDADACAYTARAYLPQPQSARGCGITRCRKREYSHFVTPMAQIHFLQIFSMTALSKYQTTKEQNRKVQANAYNDI
jgi:hypothetical protein